MTDKTILFAGLPASGKTTFLAALWYFIFNGLGKENFTFDTLENSELKYLNSISLSWSGCEKVMRTNQSNLEEVSISMKNTHTGDRVILNIPDISGERFNQQFEFRQWENDFEKILDSISGLVLFIDPRDSQNLPRLIYNENRLYKIFGDEVPNDAAQPTAQWTEKLAPSQVKLVDFLQMLDYHKPGSVKKIAVVVSCWDLITNTSDPKTWCKLNVPLLNQYLLANERLFCSKYFGLSSQGGPYEPEESRMKLLEKAPMERIIVTDGTNISNNILSPILWLTDEN